MTNYVPEIFELVGSATTCWDKDGVFDESAAVKIADRLCEIVREQREEATRKYRIQELRRKNGRRKVGQ